MPLHVAYAKILPKAPKLTQSCIHCRARHCATKSPPALDDSQLCVVEGSPRTSRHERRPQDPMSSFTEKCEFPKTHGLTHGVVYPLLNKSRAGSESTFTWKTCEILHRSRLPHDRTLSNQAHGEDTETATEVTPQANKAPTSDRQVQGTAEVIRGMISKKIQFSCTPRAMQALSK